MLKKFVLAMALLGCAMKYTLAEQITLPAENLNFQIAGIVLEQADIPRGQERDYYVAIAALFRCNRQGRGEQVVGERTVLGFG